MSGVVHAMRAMLCLAAGIGAFAVMSRAYAADPLTVIELRHRSAEEVLPVLRQLAGSSVSVSGVDYKVLVRGSAADVAQLREAIAVLDRAPRTLRVSVRYTTEASSANSGVRVVTGSGGATTSANATVRTASDAAVTSVQLIEGNSAQIAHGVSAPMVTAVAVARRGSGIAVEYREIASGFTVTPRINGERAMIDIVSEQQRAANSTSASTQRVATTVAARLGEWTELGGVTEGGSAVDGGASLAGGTRRTTTQSDRRVIEVKVDVLE